MLKIRGECRRRDAVRCLSSILCNHHIENPLWLITKWMKLLSECTDSTICIEWANVKWKEKTQASSRLYKDFPVAVALQQNCLDEDAFHWEVGKHFCANNARSDLKVNLQGTLFSLSAVIFDVARRESVSASEKLGKKCLWAVRCLSILKIWLYACVLIL